MSEIISYQSSQLPDTLEDLTQFVLVGKATLNAYMIKLRTVNKLSTAQEIRNQTLKEAQEVSTALIAAEQRIGEILLAIPKQAGGVNQYNKEEKSTRVEKSKTETIEEMGYTKDEASDYQRMAQNPEIVKRVIDDALANGKVVTTSQVVKEISEEKKRTKALEEENRKLREAISSQGAENVRLKMELKKAPAREIVKEVTVEVVPDDYEALKSKAKNADIYQNDFRHMQSEYEKMSEKWKQAEREKEQLIADRNKPESEKAENLKRSALFFCAGVSNFIEKYGGYIWLTQEIDNLEESEKEGYLRAVSALDAWVFQMKSNLEIQ